MVDPTECLEQESHHIAELSLNGPHERCLIDLVILEHQVGVVVHHLCHCVKLVQLDLSQEFSCVAIFITALREEIHFGKQKLFKVCWESISDQVVLLDNQFANICQLLLKGFFFLMLFHFFEVDDVVGLKLLQLFLFTCLDLDSMLLEESIALVEAIYHRLFLGKEELCSLLPRSRAIHKDDVIALSPLTLLQLDDLLVEQSDRGDPWHSHNFLLQRPPNMLSVLHSVKVCVALGELVLGLLQDGLVRIEAFVTRWVNLTFDKLFRFRFLLD